MSRPPPASFSADVAIATPIASDWIGDLRFFATCYAAGLLFFLVMLS